MLHIYAVDTINMAFTSHYKNNDTTFRVQCSGYDIDYGSKEQCTVLMTALYSVLNRIFTSEKVITF